MDPPASMSSISVQTTFPASSSGGILEVAEYHHQQPFTYYQPAASQFAAGQYNTPPASFSMNPSPSTLQQVASSCKEEHSSLDSKSNIPFSFMNRRSRPRPSIASIKKSLRDRECFLDLAYQKDALKELFEAVQRPPPESTVTLQLLQTELLRQQPYLHDTEHCMVVIRFDSTRKAFFEFHYSACSLPWASEDLSQWVKHVDEELVVYSMAIYEAVKTGVELAAAALEQKSSLCDDQQKMEVVKDEGAALKTVKDSVCSDVQLKKTGEEKKEEELTPKKDEKKSSSDKENSLKKETLECENNSSKKQPSLSSISLAKAININFRRVTRNSTGSKVVKSTKEAPSPAAKKAANKRRRASLPLTPTTTNSKKRPHSDSEEGDDEVESDDLGASLFSLPSSPKPNSGFVPRRNIFGQEGLPSSPGYLTNAEDELSALDEADDEDEEEDEGDDNDSGDGGESTASSLDEDKVEAEKMEAKMNSKRTTKADTQSRNRSRSRSSNQKDPRNSTPTVANSSKSKSNSKSISNTSTASSTKKSTRGPGRPRIFSPSKSFPSPIILSTSPNSRQPTECPHCQQIFARKYTLNRHIESSHKGQKPWACTWPDCGYLGGQEFQTLVHIDRCHLRASKTLAGTNPRQFLKTNRSADAVDDAEKEIVAGGEGASGEKRKSLP